MNLKIRNVQQRGDALFFRMTIPEDLRWHYGGKSEISRALRAHDELEARSWARILSVVFKRQFSDLRAGRNVAGIQEGDTIIESLLLGNSPRIIGEVPDAAVFARNTSHSLSMVYAEVRSLGRQSEKSELERGNSVKLLIEWFGDIAIETVTRSMLMEFRDQALCRMPPRMRQQSELKDKSLREIVQIDHERVVSNTTVNNRLAKLKTIFTHAVRYGYIRICPLVDLRIPVEDNFVEGRCVYSHDQLQRMVDGLALYATGRKASRHMRFWIPLIGLYTGARLNEICQLCISDVVCIEGVDCFDINARQRSETFKHVKNRASKRRIPVHPVLEELGFMRFVGHRRSRTDPSRHGTTNLWPKASHHQYKDWRNAMSHWFNVILRPRFLSEDELADHQAGRKTFSFHSLRHTFISQAQNQARMNPRIEMRLCGHMDRFISVVHARYGSDLHPAVLLEELVKLDYGLDLSKVMGRY
ncbi:site-specific integrase [Pontiella sulfatireligans]|uniref:Tyr recombinase domain-containing protein n=1 Tax=Pontiella sulfatireligans TaxID=2750658 RepID=A0A6C2URX7_9BACT|nr:site-specific integrase [Pontiella sulfatireligans]VGO22001.1 hypothetical protein SCARR_04081 [Pontiella sulfatireligans]